MRVRGRATVAVLLAAMLSVAGCANNDALSRQYRDGATKNYISGDGAVTEFDTEDTEPVEVTDTTTDGKTMTAQDYRGKVLVLTFWFALCGPCRIEASDLNSISASKSDEATFVGVNVRAEAAIAQLFIRSFKVAYTDVLDAKDSTVQLALSGSAAPNAIPSTVVLDKTGRVSARTLGVANKSDLSTLIDDASRR